MAAQHRELSWQLNLRAMEELAVGHERCGHRPRLHRQTLLGLQGPLADGHRYGFPPDCGHRNGLCTVPGCPLCMTKLRGPLPANGGAVALPATRPW